MGFLLQGAEIWYGPWNWIWKERLVDVEGDRLIISMYVSRNVNSIAGDRSIARF